MDTVLCVTARQTWSATPRVSQHCVSEMHSSEEGGEAWSKERDRLKTLLDNRRNTLVSGMRKVGSATKSTMDGFFAWIEADDPVAVAENVLKMAYSWYL